MPTEVTATVLIGSLEANSYHGEPTGERRLFCPSHMLVLMEGSRATWLVQACPLVGPGNPGRARIRPASPQRLVAAALLGYAALVNPTSVSGDARLSAAVHRDPTRADVRVAPLDADLAEHVFEVCGAQVYGLLTTLAGSSITASEVQQAAAHGLETAAAALMPAGE